MQPIYVSLVLFLLIAGGMLAIFLCIHGRPQRQLRERIPRPLPTPMESVKGEELTQLLPPDLLQQIECMQRGASRSVVVPSLCIPGASTGVESSSVPHDSLPPCSLKNIL